ncbi:cytochrome P450 [Actinocorallia populi]|uniref:cytochrome P450 n=1 Tax=Actinocorallia populi TaxID=2079200 RepID=UPI000D0966D1|nr:cytochrome P450 [Actinocorallia populi]
MTVTAPAPAGATAKRVFLRLIRPRPQADPYPDYRRLRELAPVHTIRLPGLGEAWVAAAHAEVALLLRHRDFGPLSHARLDLLSPGWRRQPLTSCIYRSMAFRSGGDHRANRGLVAGDFSARTASAHRESLTLLAEQLLDGIARDGRETDLMDTLALPFAALTIGRALGVPDGLALELSRLSRVASTVFEPMATAAQRASQHRAGERIVDLLGALLADRLRAPQDDLLTRLVSRHPAPESTETDRSTGEDEVTGRSTGEGVAAGRSDGEDEALGRSAGGDEATGRSGEEGGRGDRHAGEGRATGRSAGEGAREDVLREALSTVVMLFGAGFDSPASAVGLGAGLFMDHPEQAALLRADPSLARRAAEEVLRHDSPVHLVTRTAHRDTHLAGVPIPRDGVVFGLLASGNRDSLAVSDPDRFDITRTPTPALSFGAGAHYCLGAPLARLQSEVLFPLLFERFPGLRPAATPTYRSPGTMLRGFEHLPVRLR